MVNLGGDSIFLKYKHLIVLTLLRRMNYNVQNTFSIKVEYDIHMLDQETVILGAYFWNYFLLRKVF
jgi:hypothetical protein